MKWLSWEGGANGHGGVVGFMNPQGPHDHLSDGQTSPLRCVVLFPATAVLFEILPLKKQDSSPSAHSAKTLPSRRFLSGASLRNKGLLC